MPTFYKPYINSSEKSKAIVYPMIGVEAIVKSGKISLNEHIKQLNLAGLSETSAFLIIIIWADDKDLMADIWVFQSIESESTGYTVDCRTFRNLVETKGEGISASDGLIMLGKESELEESIRKSGGTLDDYFAAKRPDLPMDLVGGEIL